MPVAIIVAFDEKQGIGITGKLPWHYREDLQYFKSKTINQIMLMGYETYQTLPIRPLPNRTTIVATRNHDIYDEGVTVTRDVEATLQQYAISDEWLFVAGGSCIYQYALPFAEQLLITQVPGEHDVDTWFPAWNQAEFEKISQEQGEYVCFEIYQRKEAK